MGIGFYILLIRRETAIRIIKKIAKENKKNIPANIDNFTENLLERLYFAILRQFSKDYVSNFIESMFKGKLENLQREAFGLNYL